MIVRYAPSQWTGDDWDRLAALLGAYADAVREGKASVLGQLLAVPAARKGKGRRGKVTDLPEDDLPYSFKPRDGAHD
jgi:hypothetical protein